MASTTLVTFLFQAPRPVARVELLGSWDNFSKPYAMVRDRSSGSLEWRGCHLFTDIICDGDVLEGNAVKRDGGLKMGGTYWYYYRLDDDSESYAPSEPFTTSCPLLPGQHVNVLEVPMLYPCSCPASNLSTCSLDEHVFTLDPSDKFVAPQPPTLQKPKRFRLKTRRPQSSPPTNAMLSEHTPRTQNSSGCLRSRSSRILRLRSGRAMPRTSASTPTIFGTSAVDLGRRVRWSADARVRFWSPPVLGLARSRAAESSQCALIHPPTQEVLDHSKIEEPQQFADASFGAVKRSDSVPTFDHKSEQCNVSSDDDQRELRAVSAAASSHETDSSVLLPGPVDQSFDTQPPDHIAINHEAESDTPFSSKRTSGAFSLLESMAGYTNSSEHYLSQPITPSVSEFGEFVLEAFKLDDSADDNLCPVDPIRESTGFSGYNLPEAEHASAITLRAGPNARPKRPTLNLTFSNPPSDSQKVEKWNDGSERHQKSALQDLVDEMGYLSSLIA